MHTGSWIYLLVIYFHSYLHSLCCWKSCIHCFCHLLLKWWKNGMHISINWEVNKQLQADPPYNPTSTQRELCFEMFYFFLCQLWLDDINSKKMRLPYVALMLNYCIRNPENGKKRQRIKEIFSDFTRSLKWLRKILWKIDASYIFHVFCNQLKHVSQSLMWPQKLRAREAYV